MWCGSSSNLDNSSPYESTNERNVFGQANTIMQGVTISAHNQPSANGEQRMHLPRWVTITKSLIEDIVSDVDPATDLGAKPLLLASLSAVRTDWVYDLGIEPQARTTSSPGAPLSLVVTRRRSRG
jgi:hypothetical protein